MYPKTTSEILNELVNILNDEKLKEHLESVKNTDKTWAAFVHKLLVNRDGIFYHVYNDTEYEKPILELVEKFLVFELTPIKDVLESVSYRKVYFFEHSLRENTPSRKHTLLAMACLCMIHSRFSEDWAVEAFVENFLAASYNRYDTTLENIISRPRALETFTATLTSAMLEYK